MVEIRIVMLSKSEASRFVLLNGGESIFEILLFAQNDTNKYLKRQNYHDDQEANTRTSVQTPRTPDRSEA